MSRKNKGRSLRDGLLLFYLLTTALLLVIMAVFVRGIFSVSVVRLSSRFYASLLTQSARAINVQMENYHKIAAVFSENYNLRRLLGDLEDNPFLYNVSSSRIKREILKYPNKDLFENIIVYPIGLPPINCYYTRAEFEVDGQMREVFAQVSSGTETRRPFCIALQKKPLQLSMMSPVYERERLAGIIRFDLRMDFFTTILEQLEQDGGGCVRILDGKNAVLFSQDPEELSAPFDPGALPEDTVSSEISSEGWLFLATLPQEPIRRMADWFLLLFVALILLVMLVVTVYSLVCFNALLRPMGPIVEAMNRVQEGDFSVGLNPGRYREYNTITATFNHMVRRIEELLKTVYYQQNDLRRSQIAELQSKFNPHFLYNTLNMIYWQLVERGDDDSAEMIVALSDILRYSLANGSRFPALREEQRQLENYLMLQGRRLGPGFEWEVRFPPEILDLRVPCLLLQPLVENAFNHAFSGQRAYQYIGVSGTLEGERLILTVTDNGIGMSQEAIRNAFDHTRETDETGTKLGVGLVHQRLQTLYGGEYGLQIISQEGKGCIVRVTVRAGTEERGPVWTPETAVPQREGGEKECCP